MTIQLLVERFIPRKFMNTKIDDKYSPSEALGKAVICKCLDLDEAKVFRGDDKKKEPDWIIDTKQGLEVTFADTQFSDGSTAISQIFSTKTKTLSECEVIESIRNGIEKKYSKLLNKNYESVDLLSIFVFNLDPMPNWEFDEDEANAENDYKTSMAKYYETRNRNDFFLELYKTYIEPCAFENIYILDLFKEKRYHLFNIRNFIEKKGPSITTIGLTGHNILLPYCSVNVSFTRNEEEDSDFHQITLRVNTIIIETK